MSERNYIPVEVVALHEPDYSTETPPGGIPEQVELPGTYTIGVLIEGYFHPLFVEKAGKVFEGIARAKQQQPQPSQSSESETQPSG